MLEIMNATVSESDGNEVSICTTLTNTMDGLERNISISIEILPLTTSKYILQ